MSWYYLACDIHLMAAYKHCQRHSTVYDRTFCVTRACRMWRWMLQERLRIVSNSCVQIFYLQLLSPPSDDIISTNRNTKNGEKTKSTQKLNQAMEKLKSLQFFFSLIV